MKRRRVLLVPGLLLVLMGVAPPASAQPQSQAQAQAPAQAPTVTGTTCVRRHVPNWDTFDAMGPTVGNTIHKVPQDILSGLPSGPEIPDSGSDGAAFQQAVQSISTSRAMCPQGGVSSGELIERPGDGDVDVVAAVPWCVRRPAPVEGGTFAAVQRLDPHGPNVRELSSDDFQSWTVGPDIPDASQHPGQFWQAMQSILGSGAIQCAQGLSTGELIADDASHVHSVNVVAALPATSCVRRHVPDPDTLTAITQSYAPNDISTVSSDYFHSWTVGPDIPDVSQHPGGFAMAMWSMYSLNAAACGQGDFAQGGLVQTSDGTTSVLVSAGSIPPPSCSRRHVPNPTTYGAIFNAYEPYLVSSPTLTSEQAIQMLPMGDPIPDDSQSQNAFADVVATIYDQGAVGIACAQSGFSFGQMIEQSGSPDVYVVAPDTWVPISKGAAPGDAYCLRQATPPTPPAGGAVLAIPLDEQSNEPNVVVIPRGGGWVTTLCGESVATQPTTIATNAALWMSDTRHDQLTSAWGAVSVDATSPAPVLYPGRPDFRPTAIITYSGVDLQRSIAAFFQRYASCRGCMFQNARVQLRDVDESQPPANQAYRFDLSYANLEGAQLTPPYGSERPASLANWNLSGANLLDTEGLQFVVEINGNDVPMDMSGVNLSQALLPFATLDGNKMQGANLSGANLTGANLKGAVLTDATLSGAVFDGADLRGTQVSGHFSAPRSFTDVKVGPDSGRCTELKQLDFRNSPITFEITVGCEKSPLLPDSAVPLGTAAAWLEKQVPVNLTHAILVVSADDRNSLGGMDLTGVDLSYAAFVGWPLDVSQTKSGTRVVTTFDKANLTSTRFDGAILAGASFKNVTAPSASFRGAKLVASGTLAAATFANSLDAKTPTNLESANFVDADVSGVDFHDANLTNADFTRALAVATDFYGVTATDTKFIGAHIYGDGKAFDQANNMQRADFSGAVLAAGSTSFDLTHTDLTSAHFDYAQCIVCDFTGSNLSNAIFTNAYLVGSIFSSATLNGVSMDNAWLYCGDVDNTNCKDKESGEVRWPLALGIGEAYGPVAFLPTNLTGVSLEDIATCPDGTAGSTDGGCANHLLANLNDEPPPIPAACSSAAYTACPSTTETEFDASALHGRLLSVVPMTPVTWTTTLGDQAGYAVGLADGTLRQVGGGTAKILAGSAGQHCSEPTQACGDGNAASAALLGTPDGLAVGLDGSLYIADSTLHRVRRIARGANGNLSSITTVAGSGHACTNPSPSACGNGGPASEAQFVGPYGVWIDPLDRLVIADGTGGLRQIAADGTLSVLAGTDVHDVRSVTGDATGRLYAAALDPDHLIQVDTSGTVSVVVGTGTSGYNSNQDEWGSFFAGTDVQINKPGGLSVDLDGNIMFADRGNNLVRAYVPAYGTVMDDLAGVVPGSQPDGHCAWADQTRLNSPTAVASSGGPRFVVVDTGSARLLEFGPAPLDDSTASCSTRVDDVLASKIAQATQRSAAATPTPTAHTTATPVPTAHTTATPAPTAHATATPTAHAAVASATAVATQPVGTPSPTAHAANATATPLVTPRETPIATATPPVVLPSLTPTR